MLDFMRKNANSWVMIFLFGMIVFVFAVNFGPWAGSNLSASVPYAAKVNAESISMAEFRTAYTTHLARIKQFRPDYDESQAENDGIKQMILDQLISRELLNQEGKKHQLHIGARTLAQEIKLRVFGEDEDFNKEEYKRRVNGFFQVTIPQFEAQVEKELVAEQMVSLLDTTVFISDKELMQEFLDKNTKVAIEFVKIDPKHFEVENKFTPEQIASFSTENKDKIAEHYNKNLSSYVKEAKVRASHILLKLPPKPTETEKNAQKQKALTILNRIKAGEDFAAIAKAESDDPASKEQGGDLGLFSKNMMVEAFSNAAFALKVGELSDIVESPFGLHIIKALEKKDEEKRTLEQSSNEIALMLMNKQEQEQKAKDMANLALMQLKSGIALENISLANLNNKKRPSDNQNYGVNQPIADETDKFNRSSLFIPKIGKSAEVINAAFALKTPKDVSSQVIFSNDQYFVIRLKEREEADVAKFDAEKEDLKSRLTFPRKRALMQQYVAHLKKNSKITYNEELIKPVDINS